MSTGLAAAAMSLLQHTRHRYTLKGKDNLAVCVVTTATFS